MAEAVILYTTWPDAETAAAVGRAAVEAGACACVNILGPMRSVYVWEGKLEEAGETPALFKVSEAGAEALKAFILERHPYDLPCVVALPVGVEGSHPTYLGWIVANTLSSRT